MRVWSVFFLGCKCEDLECIFLGCKCEDLECIFLDCEDLAFQ